ncbi:MAG: sensor histidine kinase [Solobacterium sp.]|nr:sensor histidine kinase [Solobacterium sp.]MBQ6222365.1 sensor histidine kinase [Solobacterium sp.]MBR2669357.1 sensor histidine kinase [Solobacterium sp.]
MMEDLAMHMIEIIMNSIHANSRNISIRILDSKLQNTIRMTIQDDGKGMSEEFVKKVTDPFTTSRTTRSVGMGLAFMKGLTEQCAGDFTIESTLGVGTTLTASVQKDHIDTPPMGNIGSMMMQCIQADENIDFVLEYKTDSNEFLFRTVDIREQLEGVSMLEPSILLWIRSYINEGIEQAKEEMR